jgi:hypothetical protein
MVETGCIHINGSHGSAHWIKDLPLNTSRLGYDLLDGEEHPEQGYKRRR